MLKDKTQNLYVPNISEIDNKIDDNDGGDDDDMLYVYVCNMTCYKYVSNTDTCGKTQRHGII
jgi:hypothetical protein